MKKYTKTIAIGLLTIGLCEGYATNYEIPELRNQLTWLKTGDDKAIDKARSVANIARVEISKKIDNQTTMQDLDNRLKQVDRDYNAQSLTNPQNYIKNIEILNGDRAKTAIREYTDTIVDNYAPAIMDFAASVTTDWAPEHKEEFDSFDIISKVKEELFNDSYTGLVSQQERLLDDVKKGRISRTN